MNQKLITVFTLMFLASMGLVCPAWAQQSTTTIQGSNRVDTSVRLFDLAANKGVAVLATGNNFPDGLVGGALAGALNSGVILTSATQLEPQVLAKLRAESTQQVYILGGNSAVSSEKEAQLNQAGIKTQRLSGADRYQTAEQVANQTLQVLGGRAAVTFVATGTNFPDALSASGTAARLKGIVKLVRPGEWVGDNPQSTVTFCVGGPACQNITPGVRAVVGGDRYATAQIISEFVPPANVALVVKGYSFPDALAAGALTSSLKAVLLLSNGSNHRIPPGVQQVILIGGVTKLSGGQKPPANSKPGAGNSLQPGKNSAMTYAEYRTQVRASIHEKINEFRINGGLASLERDSRLDEYAQDWTSKMQQNHDLNHSEIDLPGNCTVVGENIGWTGFYAPTPQEQATEMTQGWWSSPGHHANLMHRGFTSTGIGFAIGSSGSYATQVFCG